MRINVYSEELTTETRIIKKEAEGQQFFGVRIFLKSHPDLYPPNHPDDDRSAVTFWFHSHAEAIRFELHLSL